MCAIQIIDSIVGSTPLVVDRCDNISALRRYLIHPESVTLGRKQADFFPACLMFTTQLTPVCHWYMFMVIIIFEFWIQLLRPYHP